MPEAGGGYLLLDLNPSVIEGVNADDSLQFQRAALPGEQPLREALMIEYPSRGTRVGCVNPIGPY